MNPVHFKYPNSLNTPFKKTSSEFYGEINNKINIKLIISILFINIVFPDIFNLYHTANDNLYITDFYNTFNFIVNTDNLNLYYLNSANPLDQFQIRILISVTILIFGLTLTNMGATLISSALSINLLYLVSNNNNKLVGNLFSAAVESIFASVHNVVVSQINTGIGQMFFPFISALFIFIVSNNLIGMIPYSFSPTSHFVLTFCLSFTIVIGATILGLAMHHLVFFSLLVPNNCPLPLLYLLVLIESISYIARSVSLGLRLAANVLSGHMLLIILSGFAYQMLNSGWNYSLLATLPLAFVVGFTGLELGIAVIQAQVFSVLSSSYMKDGLVSH